MPQEIHLTNAELRLVNDKLGRYQGTFKVISEATLQGMFFIATTEQAITTVHFFTIRIKSLFILITNNYANDAQSLVILISNYIALSPIALQLQLDYHPIPSNIQDQYSEEIEQAKTILLHHKQIL